jgi:hypothetical protein
MSVARSDHPAWGSSGSTRLSPTPQTMACLAALARPERIVFGTDRAVR